MKNIVIIGFMGTGKTTIATKLALRLKMRYVSTDDLIVVRDKRTINEIFKDSGEEYFRDIESQIIRDIAAQTGLVIDTGGGAVLRGENVDSLKSGGIIICLTARPEVIMERTKKYKNRPLLNVDDPKMKIRELLKKRGPFYACADVTIDTSGKMIDQVVDEAVRMFEQGGVGSGPKTNISTNRETPAI